MWYHGYLELYSPWDYANCVLFSIERISHSVYLYSGWQPCQARQGYIFLEGGINASPPHVLLFKYASKLYLQENTYFSYECFRPLTGWPNRTYLFCPLWMIFRPILQREGKTNFWGVSFIGASTTKCFERSRIFRCGLPKDILSNG